MSLRRTSESIHAQLLLMGNGITLIGEYKNFLSKTLFKHQCGHFWEASPGNILNGKGCPKCNAPKGKVPLVEDEVRLRLINMNNGITIIGEYKNTTSKTLFRHQCGYEWETKPSHVLSGVGCPNCTIYGFNPSKPAWTYVLKFANFIKYGITNNLNSRMRTHRRINGEFELIYSVYYEVGRSVLDWENHIKQTHGGRFTTKDECPDGWTETLSLSILPKLMAMTNSSIKLDNKVDSCYNTRIETRNPRCLPKLPTPPTSY